MVRMQSYVVTVQGLQSTQQNLWRAELSERLKKEGGPALGASHKLLTSQ